MNQKIFQSQGRKSITSWFLQKANSNLDQLSASICGWSDFLGNNPKTCNTIANKLISSRDNYVNISEFRYMFVQQTNMIQSQNPYLTS